MRGGAKTLLPLLAIGGLGIATGGFGLAGAAGAGAGAGSATVAGATAAGLGVPAGTAVTGAQALAATGPLATAGGVTAATGAAGTAATIAGGGAASGGFLSGLFGALSTADKVQLGVGALRAGASGISAMQQARAEGVGLEAAEQDAESRRLFDELTLESTLADIERRRGRALAATANAPLSSGSRQRLATAAQSGATGEAGLARAAGSLARDRTGRRLFLIRDRRRRLSGATGRAAGGALLDFGGTAANVLFA